MTTTQIKVERFSRTSRKPFRDVLAGLDVAVGHPDMGEFRTGVELIYKQLQDVLAKLGVQPIPAKGQQFDPHVHEAIEMVDTPDAADHEVLDEWQRGYKFKDRLIRPAMVRVARNSGQ